MPTQFIRAIAQELAEKTSQSPEAMDVAKHRLVLDVLNQLEMTLEDDIYPLQSKIFVHPQCTSALIQIIESSRGSGDDNDDDAKRMLIERWLETDYHDRAALEELADAVSARVACNDEINTRKLLMIFAVDGFNGYPLRNYVDNLKFQLYDHRFKLPRWKNPHIRSHRLHVNTVRYLYEVAIDKRRTLGPLKMHETVLVALKFDTRDRVDEWVEEYLRHLDEDNIQLVTTYIQNKLDEGV